MFKCQKDIFIYPIYSTVHEAIFDPIIQKNSFLAPSQPIPNGENNNCKVYTQASSQNAFVKK
jgi:hypothetical protein